MDQQKHKISQKKNNSFYEDILSMQSHKKFQNQLKKHLQVIQQKPARLFRSVYSSDRVANKVSQSNKSFTTLKGKEDQQENHSISSASFRILDQFKDNRKSEQKEILNIQKIPIFSSKEQLLANQISLKEDLSSIQFSIQSPESLKENDDTLDHLKEVLIGEESRMKEICDQSFQAINKSIQVMSTLKNQIKTSANQNKFDSNSKQLA